jgi:glucokinase
MAIKKDKAYSIGIDVGGTNLKAVLFNGQKVVTDYSLGTPKDSLEHLLIMIIALIEPLTKKAQEDKARIKGAGIGVAGIIDPKSKKIVDSPNLPILDGISLGELLENRLGMPTQIDNDAECFLRAEASLGRAVDMDNVYGLTLGTGIGGAWWQKGDIYYGQRGLSEPSRMVIDASSGTTLEEAYQKLTQNNPLNMALDVYRGDPLAKKSYEEVGKLLGIACANIVNLLDPEGIIIGGGVVESSDLFLPELKKTLEDAVPAARDIKVLKGKLGQEAGAIGAALMIK